MKFSTSLKNNYEFRRLYAKGKNAHSPYAVIYWRKNRSARNKLGITVGSKIGKAVTRNKVRRRYREIYRLHEQELRPGIDLVVVARARSVAARYDTLEADFMKLCRKLGLTRKLS